MAAGIDLAADLCWNAKFGKHQAAVKEELKHLVMV